MPILLITLLLILNHEPEPEAYWVCETPVEENGEVLLECTLEK